MKEELLSEILGERVLFITTDKDELYEKYNLDEDECEDYIIVIMSCGYMKLNKYKLTSLIQEWILKESK